MYIEEYMPTIKWVPGVKNPVADLLSCYPIEEESFDMTIFDDPTIRIQYEYTVPLKLKDIYQAQPKDPDICRLKSAAPDQIGTVFDTIGEKAGQQQALTIINQLIRRKYWCQLHKSNNSFIGTIICLFTQEQINFTTLWLNTSIGER
jgi:hypothetical protein